VKTAILITISANDTISGSGGVYFRSRAMLKQLHLTNFRQFAGDVALQLGF
jgi:hypothetical protein